MTEQQPQRTTLVLADVRDEDGTRWRAVSLTEDGGLAVLGHDLGPGVEAFYGCAEYEFERRLSRAEAGELRTLLGLPAGGDLLTAIEARFPSTSLLEEYLVECDLPGRFWSRVGD